MPEPSSQFDHRLNRGMERDGEGLLLIESTCTRCGTSVTASMRDGSVKRWESEHTCGNLRLIHPKTPSSPLTRL